MRHWRICDRATGASHWRSSDNSALAAKGFGMLIDEFGTPWIINAGQIIGS